MKSTHIIFILLSVLLFNGCRKDFRTVESTKVVFQLKFPETYNADTYPENIPLTIKNNITGEINTILSDQQGRVELDLIPGTYSLTASKAYSAEEALPITGYDNETFVNASLSPVVITEAKTVDVQLIGSKSGGLIIREFYYPGSKTPAGTNYLYDGFVEIYNNSNEAIRVDSLYMGNTKSASSSTSTAYGFVTQDSVYLAHVFMIPYEGTPKFLQPKESLVIAIDGINHKTDLNGNINSPNLGQGIADYEIFFNLANPSKDTDAPDVPNMVNVFNNSTTLVDWLPGVFGSGLVIFKVDDIDELPARKEPPGTSSTQYKSIPVSVILDGVETVANANMPASTKRLPIVIDAGMTTVGATYNGKSVRRKIKSVINGETIFVDTNNSSSDFEINNTPSPRQWN